MIQIAQLRGYELQRLFQYELSEVSMLFDEHDLFVKANKSTLMHELENILDPAEHNTFHQDNTTVFIFDVINCLRKVISKDKTTFGDVATAYITYTSTLTQLASRTDHVFDSYHECSPKDAERLKRQTSNVIEFAKIFSDVRLPVQIDTFWPSSSNKLLLQQHIAESFKSLLTSNPKCQLHIFSAFSGSQQEISVNCTSVQRGVQAIRSDLDRLSIEEADYRMLVHAEHAAKQGLKKIVFVTADTDIMVLSLFHCQKLLSIGVNEIWLRTGVGDSTRVIPIHKLAENLGQTCVLYCLHYMLYQVQIHHHHHHHRFTSIFHTKARIR